MGFYGVFLKYDSELTVGISVILEVNSVVLVAPSVYWAFSDVNFHHLKSSHRCCIPPGETNVGDFIFPIPDLVFPPVRHGAILDSLISDYAFIIPVIS